jgi:predicted permease
MGGRAQAGFRKTLVVAQVTLSLLLLIGAGLFLRSLSNLRLLNPGFRTSNLVQFSIAPGSVGYDAARSRALYQRLEERLRRIPGVSGAGLANMSVLTGNEWDNSVTIEGYQPKTGEDVDPHVNAVSPGYFDTMGIHLLAGRGFAAKDDIDAPKVAIVNSSFAKKYFGDGVAVGHRIGLGSDPGTPTDTEIVGVVNDTRYEGLRDEIPRLVYICSAQRRGIFSQNVYVRTGRDPERAFAAIRGAVRELEANLPLAGMKTVDRQLDESLITERMIATLSGVFGALATVLAIIGLYGVMAYMVARRAREIGIRMALGALAGNVVWLVMREVLVVLGAGIATGLPLAWYLSKLVQTQLYGIDPMDAVSIVSATALLAAVALLAGYIPARRAAGYDPSRVLRYE